MNSPTLSTGKQREEWIDVIKGIGILMMVIGHANPPTILRHWIYGFHMPLFFIISGLVYDNKKWEQIGFIDFTKKRFKLYVIPYVLLFFINLVIFGTAEIFFREGFSLGKIISYLLAGLYSHDTLMPNCAPLWFLTCIFISNLYFWILVKLKRFPFNILLPLMYIFLLTVICIVEKGCGISQLPWHVDVALAASLFMLIGNKLRLLIDIGEEYTFKYSYWVRWIIVFVSFTISTVIIMANGRVIMVTNQYGNMFLFFLGASIMSIVIVFCAKLAMNNRKIRDSLLVKIFVYWGKNTIVFIGFNYVFNLLAGEFFERFNVDSAIWYCITDIMLVMFGCSIIALIWNSFFSPIFLLGRQ